jgi:exopolysaccharide biosynthesis operon protein EpsL
MRFFADRVVLCGISKRSLVKIKLMQHNRENLSFCKLSSYLLPAAADVLNPRKHPSFSAANGLLTVALAACFGCSAAGAAEDSFSPYLSYSFGSDDNVLGLSNDSQYLRLTGRANGSDTTRTARGGVKAAYQVSRQNLDLSAELSKTQYSTFKALDYTGRDVRANWHWILGDALSGTIGTSDVQSINTLSNFQQVSRNLRTDKQTFANTAWMLTPSWRVLLNGSTYSLRYDLGWQQYSNIDENKVESGISYVAESGNSMGVLLRRMNGKYPNRALFTGKDENFEQNEAKANIDWLVSGKSRLQMLFGWTSHDTEGAFSRKFSGPTARATLTSATSGKTSVSASVWKEVTAVDDVLASYSVNKGASFAPAWSVSEKVTLSADVRYEKRDFQGSNVATTGAVYVRDRSTSLVMAYTPFRNAVVQASGFAFSRQGNAYGGAYKRRGATLTAQYSF